MIKKASLILGLCACSLSLFGQVYSQQRTTAAAVSEATDREKDGLIGPVRRVTVESAKIGFKGGTTVEGPRVLRGITTYDPRGKKIDTVAYPVEGTSLPGKEQYKYDDKGNIIEMQLRGPDGAILSKEIYRYQLDQLGNWKQMTTSLAVLQDGKLTDEPVEVTYRTITYFYSEETAKLVSTSSTKQPAPKSTKSGPDTSKSGADTSRIPKQAVTEAPSAQSSPNKVEPIYTNVAEPSNPSAGRVVIPEPVATTKSAEESARTDSVPESRTIPAPSIPVLHLSEEVLRKAALSLPQPAYPQAAELARTQGKVEVEIIVDETGAVTSARGMSGQPLLNEAAEVAARAARFSPTGLSQAPAKAMGILSYDFVLPVKVTVDESSKSPEPETRGAANNSSSRANANKAGSPGAVATPVSQPASEESQTAAYFYKLGISYLDSAKPTDAVQALNRAVYKDPEFAAAYVKLGLAYSALRQYKEAIAVFKMAIRINHELVDAEAYYQMGQAYSGLGKHSDALGAFKQALYLAKSSAITPEGQKGPAVPSAEELHYGLGLAYHNLARFEDSIKELKQVIALNPQLAEAYYGLAVCYIGLGDRRSAEKQKSILEGLNPALAERVSQALASNRNMPPGVNEGILGRRRF